MEQILTKRSNEETTEDEVAAERRGGHNIVKSPSLSPQPIDCDEINTPFFAEQLTAFEIWLEYAASKPKNQLVIKSPPVSVGLGSFLMIYHTPNPTFRDRLVCSLRTRIHPCHSFSRRRMPGGQRTSWIHRRNSRSSFRFFCPKPIEFVLLCS